MICLLLRVDLLTLELAHHLHHLRGGQKPDDPQIETRVHYSDPAKLKDAPDPESLFRNEKFPVVFAVAAGA